MSVVINPAFLSTNKSWFIKSLWRGRPRHRDIFARTWYWSRSTFPVILIPVATRVASTGSICATIHPNNDEIICKGCQNESNEEE